MDGTRILATRLDTAGDLILTGPAIRALAASGRPVDLLCGPYGQAAAGLLPGPADVIVWDGAWAGYAPRAGYTPDVLALVDQLAARRYSDAVIFTSYPQSPLTLALLLRFAGIRRICAVSEQHVPGQLLDVRHQLRGEPHEVVRALSLAAAAGFCLPPGDDGRLSVRQPLPDVRALTGVDPYVVVHPGGDVTGAQVRGLAEAGLRVLVVGPPGMEQRTAEVAGAHGEDLGGTTDLPALAAVMAGAEVVVTGDTGAGHLAAAVGTPVVSLLRTTRRSVPYRVPSRALRRDHSETVAPPDVVGAVTALLPEQVAA
jgi:ADP-heptose:LPS heptosyltransferase